MIGVAQGLGVNGAVVSGGSMTVEGNPAMAEVTVKPARRRASSP